MHTAENGREKEWEKIRMPYNFGNLVKWKKMFILQNQYSDKSMQERNLNQRKTKYLPEPWSI